LTIPTDVRLHDEAVRDRDAQLGTWVADRHAQLSADCKTARDQQDAIPDAGAPGLNPEQVEAIHDARESTLRFIDREIVDRRGQALHQYRDEERRAHIDCAQVLASEGWAHRWFRRLAHHAPPDLGTPAQAEPILDLWRRQSTMWPGAGVWPDDATKRTLDSVLNAPRLIEP
jgi:hypothetical protein